MFFLFGCAQKKETARDVQRWLDRAFPGQFEVSKTKFLKNQWISDDRSQFIITIGEKHDPELQFEIVWDKKLENGGQTPEGFNAAYRQAREELDQARTLHVLLLQYGLMRASTGRQGRQTDIVVFTEPTPERRLQVYAAVQASLANWPPAAQTHIRLMFMEETAWGESFQDIIPTKWVGGPDKAHALLDNCIAYLETPWPGAPRAADWEVRLMVNPYARRTEAFRDTAFQQAELWAESKLDDRYRLDTEYRITAERDKADPMAIQYSFAYFLKNNKAASTEPEGYITVLYQTDAKTCKRFKIEK